MADYLYMTPEDFVEWLRGYLTVSERFYFRVNIKTELDRVFDKEKNRDYLDYHFCHWLRGILDGVDLTIQPELTVIHTELELCRGYLMEEE